MKSRAGVTLVEVVVFGTVGIALMTGAISFFARDGSTAAGCEAFLALGGETRLLEVTLRQDLALAMYGKAPRIEDGRLELSLNRRSQAGSTVATQVRVIYALAAGGITRSEERAGGQRSARRVCHLTCRKLQFEFLDPASKLLRTSVELAGPERSGRAAVLASSFLWCRSAPGGRTDLSEVKP